MPYLTCSIFCMLTITLVLECDHTIVLTLLLRYPRPKPPHLPATFVSDAIYLRDHLNSTGGAYIISKYTNKPPEVASLISPLQSPLSNPSRKAWEAGSPCNRSVSPLSGLTAKHTQVQGGFDQFVNDLAKGVFDTRKLWDLNKMFSKIMEELNRKVEGFQHIDTRGHKITHGGSSDSAYDLQWKLIATMKERNELLVQALEKTYVELETLVGDQLEFKPTLRRIKLVQTCLQDASIEIDRTNLFTDQNPRAPISSMDTDTPLLMTHPQCQKSDLPIVTHDDKVIITSTPLQLRLPLLPHSPHSLSPTLPQITTQSTSNATTLPVSQHRSPSPSSSPSTQLEKQPLASVTASSSNVLLTHERSSSLKAASINYPTEHISIARTQHVRPSLAQSAFAWMLGEHPLSSENDGGEGNGGGSNDLNGQLFGAEEDRSRSGSLKGKRNQKQAMLFGEK